MVATPGPASSTQLAIVRDLRAKVATLEAENAALRERVAELVEFERVRVFDRAERTLRAKRRWELH